MKSHEPPIAMSPINEEPFCSEIPVADIPEREENPKKSHFEAESSRTGISGTDQPNILRALIACDVLIRNMRHRDARWHDDPTVQALLDENTRVIQRESSKPPERESVNLALAANAMIQAAKEAGPAYLYDSATDFYRLLAKACAATWSLTTDDEQGRRG